ncbi:hypothetical protein NDU88_004551 [Pleurodeles waltl]|uniref:Uncharacterized protein n=1 Tax=Pleurodeles waltl TaxID=8319 RepID=A0AAV7V4T1_PLEWA|nr:hypothetical protein NDU88_004551 [Pleurodeles waltl]
MENAITLLTAETKSMRLDIAGFQSRVTGLEQCVTTMEGHITTSQDRDQELLYLRSKLIDLEEKNYRDKVCFLDSRKERSNSVGRIGMPCSPSLLGPRLAECVGFTGTDPPSTDKDLWGFAPLPLPLIL